MFAKFNYSPSGAFYNSVINHYYTIGVDLFTSHEKEVQGCLAKYITEDGIINGTELKERWFSITPKDIFISHSHNDLNRVLPDICEESSESLVTSALSASQLSPSIKAHFFMAQWAT